MPPLPVQECVLALPAECEEQQMKQFEEYLRKAIEHAPTSDVEDRLRSMLPQAGARSGGGGTGNPPQPGKPQ